MRKTEILEELPKLTKTECQEIRLRLAELDNDDWLDDEDPLTVHEKALLEARIAAYAKDPDAGSTWEEVEGRVRTRLNRRPNGRSGIYSSEPSGGLYRRSLCRITAAELISECRNMD